MTSPHQQLAWAFKRLAQAQSNRLDTLRFNAAFEALPNEGAPQQILAQLCQGMGMQNPQWLKVPRLTSVFGPYRQRWLGRSDRPNITRQLGSPKPSEYASPLADRPR